MDEVRAVFVGAAEARQKRARENLSSLLQDVMKHRRTEIEYLNGHVARRGAELGIATPANEMVVELVLRLERGQLTRDPANLDLFLPATGGARPH
jgi:2-dehydropantoate 2-reductase